MGSSNALWPFREAQIQSLTTLLQQPDMPTVFVSGEPSTGKTGVVRHVLRTLTHIKMVYINCIEHKRQTQVARALVSQLKSNKRSKDESYTGAAGTGNIDLLEQLPRLIRGTTSVYVVLDAADALLEPHVLPFLQRTKELLDLQMGIIVITQLPWGCAQFVGRAAAVPVPAVVHFPQYTDEQASAILQHSIPRGINPTAYKQLITTLVTQLWRRTRILQDIKVVVQQLLHRYVQLWEQHDGRVRDVYAGFKPYLKKVLDDVATGEGCATMHSWDHVVRGTGKKTSSQPTIPSSAFDADLPYLAKFLLLAGYIASRNKPSVDRRLFCTEGGGRLRNRAQYDRQVADAAAVAAQGPGSFSRERLLAVFWSLLQLEAGAGVGSGAGATQPKGQQQKGGRSTRELRGAVYEEDDGVDEELLDDTLRMAGDVMQQLSSLVGLRLFVLVGGQVLEGATYRCEMSDDMARALAANVDVQLENYVMYA